MGVREKRENNGMKYELQLQRSASKLQETKTQVTAAGATKTTQHMCGLGGDGNTREINVNVISCGSRNKKLPSIMDPSVPAPSSSAAV